MSNEASSSKPKSKGSLFGRLLGSRLKSKSGKSEGKKKEKEEERGPEKDTDEGWGSSSKSKSGKSEGKKKEEEMRAEKDTDEGWDSESEAPDNPPAYEELDSSTTVAPPEKQEPPRYFHFKLDRFGPEESLLLPTFSGFANYKELLSRLQSYDIKVLLDNSDSMETDASPEEECKAKERQEKEKGGTNVISPTKRWRHVSKIMVAIAQFITKYDDDGIDVYFINDSSVDGQNVKTEEEVYALLKKADIHGGTPTANKLQVILEEYWEKRGFRAALDEARRCGGSAAEILEKMSGKESKQLFLIVITDGVEDDKEKNLYYKRTVEEVIVRYARELDELGRPDREVVIQLCQVGIEENEEERKRLEAYLDGLDNCLMKTHGIKRDMVDRVPFEDTYDAETHEFKVDGIMKILMGSVVKALDAVKVAEMNEELGKWIHPK
ncbi:hypothetical protein BJ508DRAFT_416551 [Ascobolus immersus RN42]|uniref:VWFA domain-containing protein n=1 Tax=Ascobolus immersus RN42 TaxID=1160509 RepID=A0A3N4HZ31_ASCIM|nr:hypothetical protein BJ508DRAFT_416551 [Ascobolus immersus RN42]